MTRILIGTATFLALVSQQAISASYSVAWSYWSSASAAAPVPIPRESLFLTALLLVAVAVVVNRKHLKQGFLTLSVAAVTAGMFAHVEPLSASSQSRTTSVTDEGGQTTLTCYGPTLVVTAQTDVFISQIQPDFDLSTATTLACGNTCSGGMTLRAGSSCTLRCPGGSTIDSDGDSYADTVDGRECDETSSFGMRFSGV